MAVISRASLRSPCLFLFVRSAEFVTRGNFFNIDMKTSYLPAEHTFYCSGKESHLVQCDFLDYEEYASLHCNIENAAGVSCVSNGESNFDRLFLLQLAIKCLKCKENKVVKMLRGKSPRLKYIVRRVTSFFLISKFLRSIVFYKYIYNDYICFYIR